MRLIQFQLPPLIGILSLATLAFTAVTPSTVFPLPGPLLESSSWFENLAVRPNGLILATRGDAPEIWHIDPATRTGAVLVSLSPETGAFNLTGIAQVSGGGSESGSGKETYVFGSSQIPAPLQVTPGSAKVWKLVFESNLNTSSLTLSLLAEMPDAGFINGIAAWSSGSLLLSDTERSVVYMMDLTTGAYTTPLTNLSGINGIQTVLPSGGKPGYVYRVDFFSLTLGRIPLDGATATALGPEEIVVEGQLIDDFALQIHGNSGAGKAYLGTMFENSVVEVAFGPPTGGKGKGKGKGSGGGGKKRLVAGNLTGTGSGLCTVAVFGRREEDKNVLYVAVGQGGEGGGNAKIVALDLGEL